MKHKVVKYIAYFDKQDSEIERNYVTSASNKVEYIAKAIAYNNVDVEIVSVSEVTERNFKFYPFEKKQIANSVALSLPLSWGGSNLILRKIKIIWHLIFLFLYLLCTCNKNDTVIVYHSLGYFDVIRWAKKLRNFKLILEVEEIYSDVSKMSSYWRKLEFRMFDIADAFIFSNDFLDDKINKHHKLSTVIYGTYQVEPKRIERFNDGKIHVVYAGTFDPNKGGAQTAISAAEYLPENYHIHICGFGGPQDIDNVKSLIRDCRTKSKATLTYDGLKKGSEFIEFLQRCHIGLSTQKPQGEYNNTSFPSKILTYMANGLAVVSIRIPVLEKATIANAITFYDTPNGRVLADAIMHCNYQQYSRELLYSLDKSFKQKIIKLLDI